MQAPAAAYRSIFGSEHRLYVYGGLQILKGPLGDFHKINLSDKEPIYKW
jgi:hypothetical protein